MGRTERRQQEKRERQAAMAMVPYKDQVLFSKIRNDKITADDLERMEKLGYEKGYRTAGIIAADNTMKNCYAAAALALAELYDADQDAVCAFLQCLDEKIAYALDSHEAMQKVFDDLNISLNFKEPMERIRRKAG